MIKIVEDINDDKRVLHGNQRFHRCQGANETTSVHKLDRLWV